MRKSHYLLMYDISENRLRAKTQKILLKDGWTMLQYSVYLHDVSQQQLLKTEGKIVDLLDPMSNDSVYYVKADLGTLCAGRFGGKVRMYLSDEIENIMF